MTERIDLKALKEAARTDVFGEPETQPVTVMASHLQALVDVVEAARAYTDIDVLSNDEERLWDELRAALHPFTEST